MVIPNPSILLVQREEACLKFLRECLSSWAFNVDATHDGFQALELLAQHQYELIITDDRLPAFNPLRLIQQVREFTMENYGIAIPVFGINGSAFPERTKELSSVGCSEVFCKPLTERELIEMRYLIYNHLYASWWFRRKSKRSIYKIT